MKSLANVDEIAEARLNAEVDAIDKVVEARLPADGSSERWKR